MVDCDPSYQTIKSGNGERLSAQLTIDNDKGPSCRQAIRRWLPRRWSHRCIVVFSIRVCGHGGGSFILKSKTGQPMSSCPVHRQTALV